MAQFEISAVFDGVILSAAVFPVERTNSCYGTAGMVTSRVGPLKCARLGA